LNQALVDFSEIFSRFIENNFFFFVGRSLFDLNTVQNEGKGGFGRSALVFEAASKIICRSNFISSFGGGTNRRALHGTNWLPSSR
jgi:hypothetical protein